MLKHNLTIAVIAAAWLFCGGGGDPRGRKALSGTVSVDGARLGQGQIRFQPMETQATSEGSIITSGKFNLPREFGLVPGKYRVEVNAAIPGPAGKQDIVAQPGMPPPPPKEMIPPEWNVASEHTIEV